MDLHHSQSVSYANIIDQRSHVVPDCPAIFWLCARKSDGLFIEFDIAEGGIDDIGLNAGLKNLDPKSCHAFLKRRCSNRIDRHPCGNDGS